MEVRELQVGQHLGKVDGSELLDGLDLDDDLSVDQKIDPVPGIDQDLIVPNRQVLLAFNVEASFSQLVRQTRLVSRFEQPRAQSRMDLERGAENPLRERIQGSTPRQSSVSHCSSVV